MYQALEPQDEYISNEKSSRKAAGIYQVGQDGEGNRKIFFDGPAKSGNAQKKGQPKISGGNPEGDSKGCTTDTDKVDQEIKRLKEKKMQLGQQIKAVRGEVEKIRELEKKLAQVEKELSQKDNDSYKRQNATVSGA